MVGTLILNRSTLLVGLVVAGAIAAVGLYGLFTNLPPDTSVPDDQVNPSISILECNGSCGDILEPSIEFERDGDLVIITYREPTSVPCFRHVIEDTIIRERFPPSIDIELGLESTQDQCIECVGFVETIIQVGPIPAGTDVAVNGLRVVV